MYKRVDCAQCRQGRQGECQCAHVLGLRELAVALALVATVFGVVAILAWLR